MTFDFRSLQIRTNKIIVSGSTGTNAALMVYPSLIATDNAGSIKAGALAGSAIGTDVFLFVSGATDEKTLFGGDVHISGTISAGGGLGGSADTTTDTSTATTGSEAVAITTYSTLGANKTISIKTTILGVATGSNDHAKFIVESVFSRTGSNAEEKDVNFISIFKDNSLWDVSFATSAGDIITYVTGSTSSSVEWRCLQEINEHG